MTIEQSENLVYLALLIGISVWISYAWYRHHEHIPNQNKLLPEPRNHKCSGKYVGKIWRAETWGDLDQHAIFKGLQEDTKGNVSLLYDCRQCGCTLCFEHKTARPAKEQDRQKPEALGAPSSQGSIP